MDVLGLRSLGIVAVCIQHMPWEETGKKPVDRVPRITTTSQRSRPRAPQILATAPPSYRRYHRANNVVTETVDGMEEFLLRWADKYGWQRPG